ncbi:MAG: DUF3499 family protein [Acidimicrobiales bacterium]
MAGSATASLLKPLRNDPGLRPRLCARPACATGAAATMTYDYGARRAWLDELDADASPAGYDLCADHADRLGVPSGWTRSDRRRPAAPPPRLMF